jgi:hypothetical protein
MIMSHSAINFVAALVCLSGLTGFYLWTSRINQFFFFGRTLPQGFAATAAGARVTKEYRQRIPIGLALSVGLFLALSLLGGVSVAISLVAAVAVQAVVFNVVFALAHRDGGIAFKDSEWHAGEGVNRETQSQRSVSVALLEQDSPRVQSLFAIIPPVVCAACCWLVAMMISHRRFVALNDAIDAGGGATLGGLGAGLLVASLGVFLLLRYSARRRTAMAWYKMRTFVLLAWIGAMAFAGAVLAAAFDIPVSKTASQTILFTAFAVAVLHLVYGLAQMRRFAPPAAEQNGDHLWRWGLFYYNPADPAILVQRRTGTGYTMNFGNIFSWPLVMVVYGNLAFLITRLHR